MAKVVLQHVTKKFGSVVAVDDLTLEVRDGEFFSLVGPSGCGKSTALRLIADSNSPPPAISTSARTLSIS